MSVESFSDFFMSPSGGAAGVVVLLLLVAMFTLNMRKKEILSPKTLTYSAIAIALATVLSNIKLFEMPYGGTVTACSMIFVTFIGYWFGSFAGIVAAVSYGILQMIFDPYIIHPIQLLLDYPIAFGILGVSGFFAKSKGGLYKGYVAGALGRWFFSTLSGIVFFYEYAGDQNVFVYSALYNLSYIGPEMVISLALISVPAFKNAIDSVKALAQKQGGEERFSANF